LKEGKAMAEIKSSWEIALEKSKKMEGEDPILLSPKEKDEIAEIRKVYSARIAEAEILIPDLEKRDREIDRMKRERDRKVESIYEKARESRKK
jgi:hypothetical protein